MCGCVYALCVSVTFWAVYNATEYCIYRFETSLEKWCSIRHVTSLMDDIEIVRNHVNVIKKLNEKTTFYTLCQCGLIFHLKKHVQESKWPESISSVVPPSHNYITILCFLQITCRLLLELMTTHILHYEDVLLPSSRRFTTITSKTNRKRDSFIPMSVRLLNNKHLWRLREHLSHYVVFVYFICYLWKDDHNYNYNLQLYYRIVLFYYG